MDIKSTNSYSAAVPPAVATPTVKPAIMQQEVAEAGTSKPENDTEQSSVKTDARNQLNKTEVEEITEGLNDFMQSINTDIKFVLHQKTDVLMVQVVDMEKHKVLREAPPKELLDVLARIRDFVGALLDKKV